MDLTIILSTLTMLLLAEIGDKTQLAAVAISLCSVKVKARIFIGCILGFSIVNIVTISVGGFLSSMLPYTLIKIVSAMAFFTFGILLLRRGEEVLSPINGRYGLISSTILIGSLELGDKTNLVSLGLATYFGLSSIYELMIGLVFASIILMGIAFISASILPRFISRSRLRYISASISILVALYMLAEVIVYNLS
ncbi:MAG: TMEM165/GDT1 family protein [Nitrososphaerota archaeon]|nr:TMEM165/GDT1 family protein [Candidatus Bathyarchaeota archaeon]MDW8061340.1 TMEM165/GDT1 family protein [Nitrososphaerota archaeon]